MATTAIWDVRGAIGKVIDYAENSEKTDGRIWSAAERAGMLDVMEEAMRDAQERGLLNVLEYAADDFKTEQRFFVSGINCKTDIARQQMILTKKQWQKEGGIVAYHGYQSFAPNEVTPELAHRIGVELAEKLWGDRFEVVVTTHLNTHCIHNHFVLNSVSFKDGRRYYDNKATYALMRGTSDELCRAYRLSVIKNAKRRHRSRAEWEAERDGRPTWQTGVLEDIDRAVKASMTWSAFIRLLREQGYAVKTKVKYVAVRPPGKDRFVRLRSFGEQYTEDFIKERILRQRVPTRETQTKQTKPTAVIRVRVRGDYTLSKVTWKGLRALYFFYLRKLRAAERRPQERASYLIRDDLRQLDRINEQTKFLFRHRIDSGEQLAEYRSQAEHDIDKLVLERRELSNEKRRLGVGEGRQAEISAQIKGISARLKRLRRDVKLCGDISVRARDIAEKRKTLMELGVMRGKEACVQQRAEKDR